MTWSAPGPRANVCSSLPRQTVPPRTDGSRPMTPVPNCLEDGLWLFADLDSDVTRKREPWNPVAGARLSGKPPTGLGTHTVVSP